MKSRIAPTTRANSPIAPYPPGTAHFGDDIALTNVLSFEVKPSWEAGPGVRGPRASFPDPAPGAALDETGAGPPRPNSEFPHDDLPPVPATENPNPRFDAVVPPPANRPRVFDTWNVRSGWNTPGTQDSLPLRIRVTAVQVKLRVFDPKNLQTRQLTFIVPQ